jgi:hypothetical protein
MSFQQDPSLVFRNSVAVVRYRSHMRAGEILSFHNRRAPMSDDNEIQLHVTSGGPSYSEMDEAFCWP